MKRSWLAVAFALAMGAGSAFPASAAPSQPTDPAISYVVAHDDTLIGLAGRYLAGNRAAAQVQAINHIRDPRRIPVGTRLLIPRRLLRYEPVALRIATFSGPVSVIAPSGAAGARRGDVVAEGSELETGANGFVTLTGSDGSRISLPSQSRVRVVEARRYLINRASSIDLEILRGRADVSAAKQQPEGRFQLRTPVSVSAVRGTQFRVGFEEVRGAGTTEVLEGLVGVTTPAAGLDLPPGFGAAAARDGGLAKEALLPPPDAVNAGRVQTEPLVGFALVPVAGAAAYRLQLARDAGFVDVVAEQSGEAPSGAFEGLANGRYFLRATAIARSGIEGLGQTWSFRRQQVGIKASAGPADDGFRFDWLAEGEGASRYRFQLFAEGREDTPLVDEAGLEQPGLTLSSLASGTYRWRVGVVQVTADGAAEVWTPLEKLSVGD